ncbi:uncharacterized protein LOC134222372 [Armigeres subalbatus]|uniref:uncharacterized protein LOC134222372 n=1 Tax=Armigeres subalbatus TaxID=124917 RepID=UPI002ED2237A
MKVRHRVEAKIKSRVSPFSQRMEFLVLLTVTSNLPTTSVRRADWKITEGVELTDPSFFEAAAVDLVLGIQHSFDLFKSRKVSLGNGLSTLNESVFDWIDSGVVNDAGAVVQQSCYTAMATGFDELINRFWSCEELETSNNYSPEEHFKRTVRRSENGRYPSTLILPASDISHLGECINGQGVAYLLGLWYILLAG